LKIKCLVKCFVLNEIHLIYLCYPIQLYYY